MKRTPLITAIGLAISLASFSGVSSNKFTSASADTTIKPIANYQFNDTSNIGKDSSGNGFDLSILENLPSSGDVLNIQGSGSGSYLHVVTDDSKGATDPYGRYDLRNGRALYAKQLGNSGYDFSDMITGSYTINFTAKFDASKKNTGNYMISFGLYEDCFTVSPHTDLIGGVEKSFIEFQFHNSGLMGLTNDSETKTSDTGRKIDGYVSRYDLTGNTAEYKNNWHTFTVVGNAETGRVRLFINGTAVAFKNRNLNTTYSAAEGRLIDNGVKLTDLTGASGGTYTFCLGAQSNYSGISGRQFSNFDMKSFQIYNCALSDANVQAIYNNGGGKGGNALLSNESKQTISSVSLRSEDVDNINLNITDVNSVDLLVKEKYGKGGLPDKVKVNGSTETDVFWYADPNGSVRKIYGVPLTNGLINADFASKRISLDYQYVCDFSYNADDVTVSNIKINNSAYVPGTALNYTPGTGMKFTLTFHLKVKKGKSQIDAIMYNGANYYKSNKSATEDDFTINITAGALIQLEIGTLRGKISYRTRDGAVTFEDSYYSYQGTEDLQPKSSLDLVVANSSYYVKETNGIYCYSDPSCTTPFTKANLDYENVPNITLYVELELMPTGTFTVDAEWNNAQGSVLNVSPSYQAGSMTSILITANDGYKIKAITWNAENVVILNEGSMLLERIVYSNSRLIVYFEVDNTIRVRVNKTGNGTVDVDKDVYVSGDTPVVTITPDEGYDITSVFWGAEEVPITSRKELIINDRVITKSTTLTVRFSEEELFHVLVGTSDHANIEVNEEAFKYGDTAVIKVTPEEGYQIDKIKFDTEYIEIENPIYVVFAREMTKNCSLIVLTKPEEKYHITVLPYDGGTVVDANEETGYRPGLDYSDVTITANSGKEIKSVYWGSEALEIPSDRHEMVINDRMMTSNITLQVTFGDISTYTLTSQTNEGGVVEINKAAYYSGETSDATVRANSGYHIQSVLFNNEPLEITDNQVMDVNEIITKNSKIKVTFEEDVSYVITSSYNDAYGSVEIEGEKASYQPGDEVTVTVTAFEGYEIRKIRWGSSDVDFDDPSSFTFTKTINSNVNFVVSFASTGSSETEYYLNVDCDNEKGVVEGVDYTYSPNAVCDFYVTAKDGYEISSILWNGEELLSESYNKVAFHTSKSIDANTDLVISFVEKESYKIDIDYDSNFITVTGNKSGSYLPGEEYNVEIFAKPGYKIESILVNGSEVEEASGVSYYLLTGAIDENLSVVVTEAEITTYTIFGVYGNSSFVNRKEYYNYNELASITLESQPGYVITSISYNDNVIASGLYVTTYSFNQLILGNGNLIVITAAKNTYNVTSGAPQGGTITGIESQYDDINNVATITIKANEGYYISSISWDIGQISTSIEVTDSSKMTIVKVVNDDVYLDVQFVAFPNYVVNAFYDSEMIELKGLENHYQYGEVTHIHVVANEGYRIVSISWNGDYLPVNEESMLDFEVVKNIYNNASLQIVSIKRDRYNVLIANNNGGFVDGNKSYYYNGDECEIHIESLSGYEIECVTWNGVSIDLDDPYELNINRPVTSMVNLNVSFKADSGQDLYINALVTKGGHVEGVDLSFVSGDSVFIEIFADTGYEIASVTLDGVEITIDDKKEMTVLDTIYRDMALDVTFKPVSGFKIKVYTSEGGKVTGVEESYKLGDLASITITADNDTYIGEVTYNGNKVMIDDNIEMVFEKEIEEDGVLVVRFTSPDSTSDVAGCSSSIGGSLFIVSLASISIIGLIVIKRKRGNYYGA